MLMGFFLQLRIPSTTDKYNYSIELDLRKAKGTNILQFSFAFLKVFLKVSVQVRLDLPGGPHSLK